MRSSTSIVASLAMVLVGGAASADGRDRDRGGSQAFVSGIVSCFEGGPAPFTTFTSLELFAVVGVPGTPALNSGIASGRGMQATCEEAPAAIALPASPLCATSPSGGGFSFACSGKSRRVVRALGDLAKSVTSP